MSEKLYHQAILERARGALGAGRLDAPDGRAVVDNPLCGDRVGIEITLSDGHVSRLAHQVRGCVLCQAAASILAERAPGLAPAALTAAAEAARRMITAGGPIPAGWPELTIFEPVRAARSRHDCVLLPFEALEKALQEFGIPEHELTVMRVSKGGTSLAIRLPSAVVKSLGLKEGDEIEIRVAGERTFDVERDSRHAEALERMRAFRKKLPPDWKFDREEANAR